MSRSFFAAVLFFAFTGLACIETQQPQVTGSSSVIHKREANVVSLEDEVLVLINNYRGAKGLGILKANNVVAEESRKHSANMASGKVPFSHEGFNSRSKTIVNKLPSTTYVAENVAYGQRTAKEVVDDWIKSPGHKKNIEGNYSQTGIGIVADSKGVLYYTQMFIR